MKHSTYLYILGSVLIVYSLLNNDMGIPLKDIVWAGFLFTWGLLSEIKEKQNETD